MAASLLNGLSNAGTGLASYGADVAKDETVKETAASLLNNTPAPTMPPVAAAPTTYGDPSLPGPRMPAGPNPYTGPHAAALWAAELAIKGPESGGNPSAQNPVSSAGGLFQITNGTFSNALQKMGVTPPQSQDELNALKYNPDLNTKVMRQINTEAASAFDAKGLPVNVQTLQAAHRLGPVGAADAIKAAMQNPNTPLVGSGLAPDAVKGNGDIAGLTVGQFLANPYPRSGG
jgi:hypothetical protein